MPASMTAFRKSYLFEIARNIYVHSKSFTENKYIYDLPVNYTFENNLQS